jgi:hypothetical protein
MKAEGCRADSERNTQIGCLRTSEECRCGVPGSIRETPTESAMQQLAT